MNKRVKARGGLRGKGMQEKSAGSVQGGKNSLKHKSIQSNILLHREQIAIKRKHMGDINLYSYLGSAKFGVAESYVPRVL